MPFVRARLLRPKQVLYESDTGEHLVYEGGTRAWRTNNPGNIKFGSFADAHGAIGNDRLNAVFPDAQIGRDAIGALLRTPSYQRLTVAGAIARYAPPQENDTAAYQRFVARKTGLEPGRAMSSLSNQELAAVIGAIQVIEGWSPGTIRSLETSGPQDALADGSVAAVAAATGDAASWMSFAQTEAALPVRERSEWPDPGENPRILRYFSEAVGSWFTDDDRDGDETDWCAAFVNWCLESAGYAGTQHPGARSFYWPSPKFVRLAEPVYGCIVVYRDRPFDDPRWATGTGHVTFFTRRNGSKLSILGGNQGKTVQLVDWPEEFKSSQGEVIRKVAAYIMPARG
ncbi:MAG: TIGR02594 family protein [Hyphomicrobiaceae bacterium]|jgi:uncharacterized protein (TIGR02594 family)